MFEDIKFLVSVFKIKRKLRKIDKRIDKIQERICESDHRIDQIIDIMEAHDGN